jgi:hypothetical protein
MWKGRLAAMVHGRTFVGHAFESKTEKMFKLKREKNLNSA